MKYVVTEEQIKKTKEEIDNMLSDTVMNYIESMYQLYEYTEKNIFSDDLEFWDSENMDELLYFFKFEKTRYGLGTKIFFYVSTNFWNDLEDFVGELDKEFWKVFAKRNYGYTVDEIFLHRY